MVPLQNRICVWVCSANELQKMYKTQNYANKLFFSYPSSNEMNAKEILHYPHNKIPRT